MASSDDAMEHALNSAHDFYELLGVLPVANESEIRRAYRQTALKYHPDKVGADTEKLEKFHLLQIAYDVLSDSTKRQVYDNAHRARKEKAIREEQLDGRRRHLKEELERREREGANELKRKRGEAAEEDEYHRELKRLAADGARRRKEYAEKLRREAQENLDREQEERSREEPESAATPATPNPVGVDELDRTVKARWPTEMGDNTRHSQGSIAKQFGRFGKIEHTMFKTKKVKEESSKHRREYTTAYIVFASIVGAHAAVTDFPDMVAAEEKSQSSERMWRLISDVTWAHGKEPDCIPKRAPPVESQDTPPATPKVQKSGDPLRRVPSFGSFKGTPKAVSSPSSDELLMIRLKNAERKRLAEKLRQQDEEEDRAATQGLSEVSSTI
jgi:DnaJ family protein C protein 17